MKKDKKHSGPSKDELEQAININRMRRTAIRSPAARKLTKNVRLEQTVEDKQGAEYVLEDFDAEETINLPMAMNRDKPADARLLNPLAPSPGDYQVDVRSNTISQSEKVPSRK